MVTGSDLMAGYLAAVRQGVDDATAATLPTAGPRQSLYDPIDDFVARGGKALRPALCIAACRALGGTTEQAMPSAVAIELLHNAFLVHDDVEDGSESRRGAPTLHAEHGVPIAVNVGDGMAALALQSLVPNADLLGTGVHHRITAEYGSLLMASIEGQAMELGWRRENAVDLSPADYIEMVSLKTCAYTTVHPLRIGAIIGSHGRASLESITRFGLLLGIAFQITDDVLNLTGSDAYGKEIHGDLAEGKRTLLVIHLLGSVEGADRSFLEGFLARERVDRSEEDIGHVRSLMDEHGSIEYTKAYAAGIADAAVDAFGPAFGHLPPSADRRFLEEVVDFVVARAS
jgi:geranylgeranyl diphosphate synthase type II